jgi:hypothetical protein
MARKTLSLGGHWLHWQLEALELSLSDSGLTGAPCRSGHDQYSTNLNITTRWRNLECQAQTRPLGCCFVVY